jgi:hypothetical protein
MFSRDILDAGGKELNKYTDREIRSCVPWLLRTRI